MVFNSCSPVYYSGMQQRTVTPINTSVKPENKDDLLVVGGLAAAAALCIFGNLTAAEKVAQGAVKGSGKGIFKAIAGFFARKPKAATEAAKAAGEAVTGAEATAGAAKKSGIFKSIAGWFKRAPKPVSEASAEVAAETTKKPNIFKRIINVFRKKAAPVPPTAPIPPVTSASVVDGVNSSRNLIYKQKIAEIKQAIRSFMTRKPEGNRIASVDIEGINAFLKEQGLPQIRLPKNANKAKTVRAIDKYLTHLRHCTGDAAAKISAGIEDMALYV